MVKEKVCRKCKIMVEGGTCPICKGTDFTNVFQGRINVIDADKSIIANRMDLKQKGRYAIKIR